MSSLWLISSPLFLLIIQCTGQLYQNDAVNVNLEAIMYPGTKWCGAGDNARNINDLGYLRGIDSCCRTHDQCDHSIEVGETKYGITNTRSITISHCSCDLEFFKCLKMDNGINADAVKLMYKFVFSGCFVFELINKTYCGGLYTYGNQETPKKPTVEPNRLLNSMKVLFDDDQSFQRNVTMATTPWRQYRRKRQAGYYNRNIDVMYRRNMEMGELAESGNMPGIRRSKPRNNQNNWGQDDNENNDGWNSNRNGYRQQQFNPYDDPIFRRNMELGELAESGNMPGIRPSRVTTTTTTERPPQPVLPTCWQSEETKTIYFPNMK